MVRLRRVVLERLMRYYRVLSELTARRPVRTITSAQVAEALDIDPTQVRKDFGAIGLLGTGRVGFDVGGILGAIGEVLGFDREHDAVLVGMGHLGGVLLAYSGFSRYGLHIAAAFDKDKERIGHTIAGRIVRPMRALKPFIKKHKIRVAILAPPTEVSGKLTDRLVAAGVEAIWNFTPTRMAAPAGVLVRNEQHFSVGLSEITYHLTH